jgi:hypothetical protein
VNPSRCQEHRQSAGLGLGSLWNALTFIRPFIAMTAIRLRSHTTRKVLFDLLEIHLVERKRRRVS